MKDGHQLLAKPLPVFPQIWGHLAYSRRGEAYVASMARVTIQKHHRHDQCAVCQMEDNGSYAQCKMTEH